MNIRTERLIIRNFHLKDWEEVYLYTSNNSVMKYMPEGVLSKEDTQAFIKENNNKKELRNSQLY